MYILGFTIGFLAVTVALVGIGTPLLLGKGFGLLWGDRRAWWFAACLLGYVVSHYGLALMQPLKPEHDPMRDAVIASQHTGTVIGAVLLLVIGLALLNSWGVSWKPSQGLLSAVLSATVLTSMAVSGLSIQRKATATHQQVIVKLESWADAILKRNYPALRELAGQGKGEWNYVPKLKGAPVIYAHRQQDKGCNSRSR